MNKTVIVDGCKISLHFSLALSTGEIIDSNFDKTAASFKLRDGSMLPGFEACLLGKCAGDEVEVLLPPEHGFGEVNPKNIQYFPLGKFRQMLQDELIPTEVGSVISFKDAGGFDLPGVVKNIDEDSITVDFNHPLAGKSILFKAKILQVIAAELDAVEIRL